MSKPFDYSKWDNIELSDDEDDCHPNIEKESWFRLKHRTRVEREEREEKDKVRIRAEMKANLVRINELQRTLKDLAKGGGSDDDGSDDELEDIEGLEAEVIELEKKNKEHQDQLDYYEKNKKWNVDNMCTVTDERTIVSSKTDSKFDSNSGYALADEDLPKINDASLNDDDDDEKVIVEESVNKKTVTVKQTTASKKSKEQKPVSNKTKSVQKPSTSGPVPEQKFKAEGKILEYPAFVDKYEAVLEKWMTIKELNKCKEFLLLHGDILLQENAASYLLLASLEDEMNGFHEKMRLTCRQSQLLTHIAELAKTLKKHPGNVILPFFSRLEEKEAFNEFMLAVQGFIEKVKQRAIVKRKEIDAEREQERAEAGEVDLHALPREERLGPGGLDPVEVFESLPLSMQEAFESRDTEKLKKALLEMSPEDAEFHMDRCVKCGLWNQG